jgi:biopolymer transport protein ExbB
MSIVVVAVGFERLLGLRRSRIMPQRLLAKLGEMADHDLFEPRAAFRICQQYPSSASRVIRDMLLKVGRPHSEVERAVDEACQREADRLYANVRTLNMAATVAPLIGLLGTVWGMIQSFFVTANLPVGSNKGQVLAEGIYVALVTTFGGLVVAIPAAMLAHWFEGRILTLMREIESLLDTLLPHIERYEGKLRMDHEKLSGVDGSRHNRSGETTTRYE